MPLSGKTAGREVGNPGEHSGERSGGYGFSGCRARLWGGAAVCASGRRGQSLHYMKHSGDVSPACRSLM